VRKAFVSNIAIMIVANAVVKPLWVLGVDRKVQLQVGDEAFGNYMALLNLSMLFSALLDVGLTSFSNREIARKPQKLQTYFADMVGAKFILFGIYMLVLLGVGLIWQYSTQYLAMLAVLGCLQFVTSMLLFMRSNINGLQLFRTDALLSIADKVIVILILGTMLLTPSLRQFVSIYTFVVVQILASAISILLSVALLNQHNTLRWPNISLSALRQRLSVSFPVAIAIFLMFVYSKVDLFLLERLHTDGALQSGLLQKCYRVLDALNMVGFMFATLLLGLFSKMLHEQQGMEPIVKLSSSLLLPAACCASALLMWQAPLVLQTLYGNSDAMLVEAFRYIVLCFPSLCLVSIYSTLVTANRDMKKLAGVAAIGSAICIVGNLIFAAKHGYIATARIAFVTLNIVGILYAYSCTNVLGNKFLHRQMLGYLFCMAAALAANYFMQGANVSFMVSFIITCVLGLAMWYALGVFSANGTSRLRQMFASKL
jgi:O-antigen/teichoic acid export membrane protein